VALAAAAMLGDPARLVQADPQLAFLLRGMALIKSALVLAAIALLLWRFAHPVSNGFALAYIAGTAVLAAASMLIWQLSFIPLAALAFHVAALAVLLAAWRDDGSGLGNLRRARQPARSLAPQEKPATACGT
jgi:energy-converting hydrogenase Eha subunit A